MFCRACGNELPENAKFCLNCGTPAEGDVSSTGSRTNTAVEKSETDTKKPILFALFFANVFLALLPFLPTLSLSSIFSSRDLREIAMLDSSLSGSFSLHYAISLSCKTAIPDGIDIGLYSKIMCYFPLIILYGLILLQIRFLYRAAGLYYHSIITSHSRRSILKCFRRSSVVALVICSIQFGLYVLFSLGVEQGNPFDLLILFWIGLIGSVLSIKVTTNIIKQEKQNEESSKQDEEITASTTN